MSNGTFNHQTQPNGSTSALDKLDSNSKHSATVKKFCLITGGIALTITGLLTGSGYLLSHQAQQSKQENILLQLKESQASNKYDQCVRQAKALAGGSTEIANKVEGFRKACESGKSQQLFSKAQASAEGRHFKDAINTLKAIPADSVEYQQAQQLIDDWSSQILDTATKQYQAGSLDLALTWVGAIPKDSSIYQKAQTTTEGWRKEWRASKQHLNKAQEAFKIGQWDVVIVEANQVSTEYWKQKAKPVIQQAVDEKHLYAAEVAYKANQWQAALTEARQVTTPSAKSRATAVIAQVKDELHLKSARTAINATQWDEAIAEAEQVTTTIKKRQAVIIVAMANDGKHLRAAWKALNFGQWDEAITEASRVTTDYGKQQTKLIIQGASNGKQLVITQNALKSIKQELVTVKAAQASTAPAIQQAKQPVKNDDKQQLSNSQDTVRPNQSYNFNTKAPQKTATTNEELQAALTDENVIEQKVETVKPFLKEGILGPSTAIRQNGTLYQVHHFSGNSGQTVTITLESQNFKTQLLLIGPDGKVVPQKPQKPQKMNLDGSKSLSIFALPQTGTYLVRVGANESLGQGHYVLTIHQSV